jgi:hypothetical protein
MSGWQFDFFFDSLNFEEPEILAGGQAILSCGR